MFFWPQFIEVCHLAGVAPGDGGGSLDHAPGRGLQRVQVGDVLIAFHMGDNGLTVCPVLHIIGRRQHQAVGAHQVEAVVILPPDSLAPHLGRFQQVQVLGQVGAGGLPLAG